MRILAPRIALGLALLSFTATPNSLLGQISSPPSTPISGVTTFGTGGGDAELARAPGTSGVEATDVRGTGWDVRVVTTTVTPVFLAAGDLGKGTGDGIYYGDDADDGEPLASFTVSSSDGSIFDLKSFQFVAADGNDGTGRLSFRVTGYVAGYPKGGATANFTITGNSGTYPLTTVNVSADRDFDGIDAFVVTRTTGEAVHAFALDTLTVANVRPPSGPPAVANLSGDAVSFREGGSAERLDVDGNALVSDDDSADFGGGNMTVSIVANRVSTEDVLAIANEGVGPQQIGVTGSTVSYGGVAIGTFSGGTSTSDLVVLFNVKATSVATQALIRALSYANTNTIEPSGATRTVRVVVRDGDGGTSANADVSVGVAPVNDAPTLAATGLSTTLTEGGSAVDLFGSVSVGTIEPSQRVVGLSLTVGNLGNGSAEILTADGTSFPLTAGTTGTTASNAMTYTVGLTGSTATVVLSHPLGISATTARTIVDGLRYRNASDAPVEGSRVATLTGIQDNGGTANGGTDSTSVAVTATVTVRAANDAPTVTTSAGTTAFTEADGGPSTPVAVDANLTVADLDNGELASATVRISASFRAGEDVLAFTNDGATMGNIAGSWAPATGILTLTSSGTTGTLAEWEAALRSVTYSNASEVPNTTRRTVTVAVNDGTVNSTAAIKYVNVASINDAPVITAPGSVGVTEDVTSAIAGVSASDADAGSTSLTLTLTVNAGSLGAVGGGGVAVGGTATARTLTGTLANLNTFLASNAVSYTPAANATSDVALTVGISDRGFTGTGGTKTDSETIMLRVTAVNDAPVISAPGAIGIPEDVPTALTGIGIADVDADTGMLTVTLSVASGALSAQSGAGVITAGSGTGTLTLQGTSADLGAFIASGSVTFQTAPDSTSNVTLVVILDDGGNTGADPGSSGTNASEADTTTVALVVAAVNDAPVNTVPTAQTVMVDTDLVWSVANGNALSVSDVDAGAGTVQVTLTATHGLLTLSGTTGLTFLVGSGTADATMTFEGSLADINVALNGTTFSPTSGYVGLATVQITTRDEGLAGSGGTQTDTDTVDITVALPNATVTTVRSATPNGTYKVGDAIQVTVTFDQPVHVDTTGGSPTLLLETGPIDRSAAYVSGSGSPTLMFAYTVHAGDRSPDLDYASRGALVLAGATIAGASNAGAILTLPTGGGPASIAGQHAIVVDGDVPRVTSVTVPPDATYTQDQALDFLVAFDEAVTVTGAPAIGVALDAGGPLAAIYLSGSGSSTLVFRATVRIDQLDGNGIEVGALVSNGGAIADAAGNSADLTLTGVGATTGVLVDSVAPTAAIGAPSVSSTLSGPVSFVVTYTGASNISLDASHVSLVATGTAAGSVTVTGSGATTRTVTVSSITGTGTLAIAIAGGTAVDAAGNRAAAAGPSAPFTATARALTSLTPSRGEAAGGIVVTLVGAGFTQVVSPVVRFGTTPAARVEFVDDAHLRVVTPALPAGTPVDVSLIDGTHLVATLAAAYTPVDLPVGETADTDEDGLPDAWELLFGLDPNDAADAALDPDGDGLSSLDEYQRGTHPNATWTRALAEGVASSTFATDLSLFNPGVARATVRLHYLRDGASPLQETIAIAPGASFRRDVGNISGLAPSALAIEIESNEPLVATGMTRWAYGGGAESALAPAPTWYLAEGATHGPFDLFYLIANTNDTAVDVDVTFLRPAPAAPLVRRVGVPARSRLSLWVDTIDPALAATDVSAIVRSVDAQPIVVERAMYTQDGPILFGATGHRAAGVSQAETTWHFAEGYAGAPFDTYLLVANFEATEADVTIEVAGDAGLVHSERHVVAPGTRLTRYVGDMPVAGPVALTVHSTNAVPVVAERAMWFRAAAGQPWIDSHASAGATAGATRWGLTGLAVGGTGRAATYLLVQNVADADTTVTIAVSLPDGTTSTRAYPLAAASRLTVEVGADFPGTSGTVSSAIVSATTALVVEASTYWDADGTHWSAGTNVRGTPLPR